VPAVDAGSTDRELAAAALDRGGLFLKHAAVDDRGLLTRRRLGLANGRLCLLVLGLHAFSRMHFVVTHALCSVATFVVSSQTAQPQASDLR
jgi:hypothetical protein